MNSSVEGVEMPNVNLYVPDADQPIWDRARKIAGPSLSKVVRNLLSAYVEQQERRTNAKSDLQRNAEPIILEIEQDDRPSRKVKFTGILTYEGNADEYDLYVTTSGKVIVANFTGSSVTSYDKHDSFAEFVDAVGPAVPADRVATVAEALGEEWVEEID